MLVGEVNHRVKNSFAVIQALATQGDGVRSVEEYRHVLLERMGSLARIHDLLFESHWRGAELRSLAGTLQPLAGERAEALHLDARRSG
jgi:two-component system, chemotaxis family, CheB/CheR fusion protein